MRILKIPVQGNATACRLVAVDKERCVLLSGRRNSLSGYLLASILIPERVVSGRVASDRVDLERVDLERG